MCGLKQSLTPRGKLPDEDDRPVRYLTIVGVFNADVGLAEDPDL
jgi:hypothetical protein